MNLKKEPAVRRGLLDHVAPYWRKIEKACAQSLSTKAKGFLPPRPDDEVLGCGFWGCVIPTADERFVLKLTMDATEGPHVAIAMSRFQLDPGIAYFRRLWQLPGRYWTDEQGRSRIYVILRENTNVESIWKRTGRKKGPARGYARVFEGLEALPECCSCLYRSTTYSRRGLCPPDDVKKAEKDLAAILKKVGRTAHGKPSKGRYVADLIASAYRHHNVLLGDVHYANVGLRVHDLSRWKVPFHHDLVVTDLGDLGQAIRVRGSYPAIKTLQNPAMEQLAERIPTL